MWEMSFDVLCENDGIDLVVVLYTEVMFFSSKVKIFIHTIFT